MRRHGRELRLLVGTATRTAPWLAAGTLIEPLGRLVAPLFALWLAMLVDGIATGDVRATVVAVIAMLAAEILSMVTVVIGNDLRLTLTEKVGFTFDRAIAELIARPYGLEHHERADFQDRLELLRQSQSSLGGSLNSLINTANILVLAVSGFVVLAWMNPLLLLLVLFALPGVFVAAWQQRWEREAEEQSATSSRLARYLRGQAYDRNTGMEARVLGLREEILARTRAAWFASRRPLSRAKRRSQVAAGVRDACFAAGFGLAIWWLVWRARQGDASIGEVVAAVYLCQRVQQFTIMPINLVARLGAVLRAAQRFLWLRDQHAAAVAGATGSRPAPDRIAGGIVLGNVSFRYPGSNDWVLRDVSLRIPASEVVAIVGENGAGKTTLVKLLSRMYEPTSGRILVDGVDLAELDVDDWRRRLSGAFQDFARLEFELRHSVGVGDLLRLDDDPAVRASLDRAGASDLPTALPHDLGTQLGAGWDGGVDLSTGQWQKVALARAMMREAPLLLFFDEPTASLDAQTEQLLFDRCIAAARAGSANGMITVLVSHRFSTVRNADRIIVLDGNRVTETGAHGELMSRQGLYAELYMLQARSYQ